MNTYRFAELHVGMDAEFNPQARGGGISPISDNDLECFRKLTGDISPIHVDETYAIERGYRGKVCYGMLTSALYSTLVGVYLPGKYALFQEAHIFMTKPVYIGDCLTVKGKIIEINEPLKRVTIKARILRDNGETVSRATLEVGVAE